MKIIILTIIALSFVACAKSSDSNIESYSYEYEFNGCKTEQHTFNSKAAYCAGLQDDELNNHCAWQMREIDYNANCI